jgi:hypothetical protein
MTQGVRNTSLLAFEKLRRSGQLSECQSRLLQILEEIGPSHDLRILEALNQQEQVTLKNPRNKKVWQINVVTSTRNQLMSMALIHDIGVFCGIWQGRRRARHFWAVSGETRPVPPGWTKVEIFLKQRTPRTSPCMVRICAQVLRRQQRKKSAGAATSEPAGQTAPTGVADGEKLPGSDKPVPTERLLFESAPMKSQV